MGWISSWGNPMFFLRTKGIVNENYKIVTTNDTNTLLREDELLLLWSLALMTHYLTQVCFYFKNWSFLLLVVQPLLFILQLHQLPQPHIPKRTLIITNMIWTTNGLNNWMPSWKPRNLSLWNNYMSWKKWLKIWKGKKQHQMTQ